MTLLAFIVFWVLLVMALFQAIFAGCFAALLRRSKPVEREDRLPRAAILLSLRGADPQLAQGLRFLLRQDYPDYELHVVVDRRDDPTWRVVQDATCDAGRVPLHVAELREPLPTCSLKCSALVQMAAELDKSREIVVLADADVLAHPLWLRELVAPFSEPGVGAAFGNRWFMPRHGHWGSLVRYLWNVAAVVPMWLCNIPWGGTFAIRAALLRECDLLEKWARAAVDDAPVRTALAERGLRLRFVPSLMMVNREDCTLPFSLDFVTRQLMWTRLYHPNWLVVVVHAAFTTTMLAAALFTILCGLVAGNAQAATWAAAGLGIYLAAMLILTGILESGVRHVARARGESVAWLKAGILFRLPAVILITQAIHTFAVFLAMVRKIVTWRGVRYRIAGPWEIRLLENRPLEPYAETTGSNMSL